jgi:hypothetical protein
VTSTVLAPEHMAECRRRQAAGDPVPVVLMPQGDVGEDPGWYPGAPDNGRLTEQ